MELPQDLKNYEADQHPALRLMNLFLVCVVAPATGAAIYLVIAAVMSLA